MQMRRLTDAEIRTVVDEHLAMRTWEQHIERYRRFARDVFGPRAAIISLGLGLVYNDEGNEPGVATVAVYDAERNALPPRPEPWAWEGRLLAGSPRLRDAAGQMVPVVALRVSKYHFDDTLPVPESPLMHYFLDRPPHQTYDAVFAIRAWADEGSGNVGEVDSHRLRRFSANDLDLLATWDFKYFLLASQDLREYRVANPELAALVEDVDVSDDQALFEEEFYWQDTRRFVQYVYGRHAASIRREVTAERGEDGHLYTGLRITVRDANDAELQPLESNAARAHWIAGLLPWQMVSGPDQHVWEALGEALGDIELIRPRHLPDGRVRWEPLAAGVALEQVARTTIQHLDRPARPYPVALYVEDHDYSEATALVHADWSLPPIPLAPSTDLIYDGSPIEDLYPPEKLDEWPDGDSADDGADHEIDWSDFPF